MKLSGIKQKVKANLKTVNALSPMNLTLSNIPQKAVGKGGKPLVVYHGTQSHFSEFDPKQVGKNFKNERGSVGAENPQIHTDNFKNWFGDWKNKPQEASKVVDEGGKPLVVYHGTQSHFSEFDPKQVGKNFKDIGYKRGFFFSRNPDDADITMFDIPRKGNPRSIPSFIDIKNPLIVKMKTGQPLNDGWGAKASSANIWYDNNAKTIMKSAASGKKDGVIVINELDRMDRIYIPFKPNQIKSATGNSGAFSKATNDIRG